MKNFKTADVVMVSLATALMCVCSWIQFPSAVPFTLQTFAVFLIPSVLGTKKGVTATIVYVLLGAVGLPVFSGFQGGIGALAGATGGFVLGFIPASLIIGICTKKFGKSFFTSFVYSVAALAVCYVAGVLWYAFVYGGGNILSAIYVCVLPFVVPDFFKIVLANLVSEKINIEKITR